MTKVSVIIPTYNRARFVTKAIDSVLGQTYQDYEIILVDDGSQDDTRRVLEPYSGRIRYFYQNNAGVSAARNTGIRHSQGEWIAFLDSDDEWLKDYLAAQMDSARRFPEAVAHITNSIAVSEQNERQTDHFKVIGFSRKFRGKRHFIVKKPFRIIVSHQHWFLQPVIMRREVLFESGLFNDSLSIAEDMDVVARLALKGAFTFSRDILVEICRRPEDIVNLSSQYMKRGIYSRKSFGKVFSELMRMPQLTIMERIALAKALNTRWRALANLYMKTGNVAQARQYYRKSLLLYPGIKPLVKYLGSFLPHGAALLLVRKSDIIPGDEGDLL